MAKVTSRKNARRKLDEKENDKPRIDDVQSNILEDLLGDINNVVGRRSEIGKRSLCLQDNDFSIIDVDDEKEKRERKEREKAEKEKEKKTAENLKKTGINILNKLTQAELDEHYSKCIQMCNKNKVSVKNAFNLQLIDYMKGICMKQSSKTENLTLMGCTLGASAKIYSHRVDKVHTDMVIIVSGKELEAEKDDSDDGSENVFNDDEGNDVALKKSKRKKSHGNLSDDESLGKLDFNKMLSTESSLEKKKHEIQPQEKPTLPVGVDYFLDCPIKDVDGKISLNPPLFSTYELAPNDSIVLYLNGSYYNGNHECLDPLEYINEYNDLHKHFNVIGDQRKDNEEFINSSLVFDPSSRIELPDSLRLDAEDPEMGGGDGLDNDYSAMDYDEECLPEPEPLSFKDQKTGQISTNQPKSFSAISMAKLVSLKSNDYSFFDNSRLDFWAGPSHWSVKRSKDDIKEPKAGGETHKKTTKKKSYLQFDYDYLKSLKKLYSENESSTLARKTMVTWSKSKCAFPLDISYSQKELFSLFKNEEILYVKKDSKTNLLSIAALNENEEETLLTPEDFSGDLNHMGDGDGDDIFDDHCNDDFEPDIRECTSPLQNDEVPPLNTNFDLIPAPPKVNKIIVKYAKVQKRIDVKLLKNTIWSSMELEDKPKSVTQENPVKFSEIFKSLPAKLPKEDAAELSSSIAIMALLHMANEKNLCLKGTENLDDVYVSLD